MRVAVYARVSTDKQAEKYGIPSQIEALRKRSLERGFRYLMEIRMPLLTMATAGLNSTDRP